jgi:hypothetical protein
MLTGKAVSGIFLTSKIYMDGNKEGRLEMIGHVRGCGSVWGQVEMDYERARRRALFGRVSARLRRDRDRLLAFDAVRKALRADNRFCLGTRTVEVSRIVGSAGRWRQFDRGFMPVESSAETRWKRVDLAFHRGEELPLVVLYKVGEAYFVLDGNHRVSVARFQKVEMIDAEVTEFFPQWSVSSSSDREWRRGEFPIGVREGRW